jgi:hypothetical protein
MKAEELKRFADREPFRPFAVRLSAGVEYSFNEPRQFGAPRDFSVIFFFGDAGGWALIDTENIVELFPK